MSREWESDSRGENEVNGLHFVLIPLMSPGHLIPMIDTARLLAHHGALATVVTTPLNAVRFASTVRRASASGLPLRLLTLPFPAAEAGLPDGCESVDALPSRLSITNFFAAASKLQEPFDRLLSTLSPPPSCIVSGKNLPWTLETSRRFRIPRVFFDGMGCFSSFCTHAIQTSGAHQSVVSDSEPFLVPGLPHSVHLTKAKLPESLNPGSSSADLAAVRTTMRAADAEFDAILVNTFEELEADYVEKYKRVKGNRVWCIGPVSAASESDEDKMERGGETASSAEGITEWLDAWEAGSVIYACLGSICGLEAWQAKELGLGLEASNRPFIWVVRGGGEKSRGLEDWIREEGLEERTKGRGLVIRGWAPQVLILSHPSIGGFLTHCGWNSTLEGLAAGVPLITCPLFAEQFLNEVLAVEVLGVGGRVGIQAAVTWGLEGQSGLVIRRDDVQKAIHLVTDQGPAGVERRNKARELGRLARRALQRAGSSYRDMEAFIHFVKQRKSD